MRESGILNQVICWAVVIHACSTSQNHEESQFISNAVLVPWWGKKTNSIASPLKKSILKYLLTDFFSLKLEVLTKMLKQIHISLNFVGIFHSCAYYFSILTNYASSWMEKDEWSLTFLHLDGQAQGNLNVPGLARISKSYHLLWIQILLYPKQGLCPNSRFLMEVPKLSFIACCR